MPVLHVASEATIHALNRSRHHAAQPQQAMQASVTPFASLLDDSTTPPKPPKQPAADDNVNSARSEQSPQPAKSDDGKTAKTDNTTATDGNDAHTNAKTDGKPNAKADAKTDVTPDTESDAETDKTDQANQDDKTASDSNAATDATITQVTLCPDGKPSVDDKPARDPMAADANIAPPSVDPAQPTKPADANIVALAPVVVQNSAPVPGPAPAPAPVPAAANVDDADASIVTLPPTVTPGPAPVPAPASAAVAKTMPALTTTPDAPTQTQTDDGKTTGQALAAKAAPLSHGDAKPQESANDADADSNTIAHNRGEIAEGGHHATTKPTLDALPADANTLAPRTAAGIITQPTSSTTHSPASAATPAMTAPSLQAAAIPLSSVAIEVASKAVSGKNHFEIRLDPPELGRIEVHLALDRDGNITSRMIADRADTLDLLRRDAGGLERALQDAGLKTSDNGLQFSLRDQSSYQQQQQGFAGNDTAQLVVEDETLVPLDVTQRTYDRLAGLGGGLDIQV